MYATTGHTTSHEGAPVLETMEGMTVVHASMDTMEQPATKHKCSHESQFRNSLIQSGGSISRYWIWHGHTILDTKLFWVNTHQAQQILICLMYYPCIIFLSGNTTLLLKTLHVAVSYSYNVILYNYHHNTKLYRKISRVCCRLYCYECAARVTMPTATNESPV